MFVNCRGPYNSQKGMFVMYAMVCTRPDLAYVVTMVSRFLNQPQKEHWKAVKRIFSINQVYANIYCDSLSAICLAKDQVHHDRTKHIDVRYHFIRSERRFKVHKISTLHNPADMFT